ncbi:putative transcription factor interactor and regulator CCHC(Zn) family [Helianthus annuus]|uniref:Transcription factor interactor and regulator CCHC(Zn) family n=1 Tax=Helianthus annuus TaxID=4232 RepID=A0A9K3HPW9_HELAN|nr:putative transcription factor interactor and regulator CCHC(Zn) family [Helianthus annuus]KAJ0875296.1 putative Zinc finger, CCHC-type superfamily [Helianthus annuus]
MELMDIKWCMASVLRRAEKFKQITGRDDFRDACTSPLGFDKSKVTCFRCREKGNFKRECTNREASRVQNPFGNNDYHRKAIYLQVAPHQQQSSQTAHARKELIEEPSKKAYLVNQEDERLPKGFSWDKYISPESNSKRACYGLIDQDDERLPEGFSWDKWDPNRTSEKVAFVAQIYEDSTAEEELVYAYYQSQQYSPKKIEEEPVITKEASEKAPIFDHSSDEESDSDSEEIRKLEFYQREFLSNRDNFHFAGKTEKIEEKQAEKKNNHKAATIKEKDDSDDDNDNSYYAGKMKEKKKNTSCER